LDARSPFAGSGEPEDASLNVAVRGEEVIIFLPGGAAIAMSAQDATISARRLLDAAEVAKGRIPNG